MSSVSFPQFHDGDVKITVFPDVYYLHSSVLRKCSGALDRLLGNEDHMAHLLEDCSNSPRVERNIILIGSGAKKHGILECHTSECTGHIAQEIATTSLPEWSQQTRKLWANIFRIFYKLCPVLDNGGEDSLLENSLELAELGIEILANNVVFHAIEITLAGFVQQLYRCIANDPVSWVRLAVRIRSVPIFHESMVHLVGKWDLLEEDDRDFLPTDVIDLCMEKCRELNSVKKGIELRMANHLPCMVDGGFHANASGQHKNVYTWMVVAVWRQWLCQSLAENKNYRAPDGGAAFYRAIGAGGAAYLDVTDPDSFNLPLTEHQEWNELSDRLDELKDSMKAFVSGLLNNNAKYDPGILGELPYLTCCKVDDTVLPWEMPTSENSSEAQEAEGTIHANTGSNLQQDLPIDPVINPRPPRDVHGFYTGPNNNHPTNIPAFPGSSNYGPPNTLPQRDYMAWNYLNFDATTTATFNSGPQPPVYYGIGDHVWCTPSYQGNNWYNIDTTFGVPPLMELDEPFQHDGSMAFL